MLGKFPAKEALLVGPKRVDRSRVGSNVAPAGFPTHTLQLPRRPLHSVCTHHQAAQAKPL